MSLTKKVKKAGVWQALEIGSLVLAQFLYIAVMARLLNKADFGLMAIASSFVGFGQIFSDGGMGPALIQRKEISQKHKNAALQGGITLGLVVFVLFFFSAPYISVFFEAPQLNNIIRVIGINVILISTSSISLGLLHREFMFKHVASISVLAVIVGYSSGIMGAISGLGVWSLVLATLVMETIKAGGYLLCAPVELRLKFYGKEWRELFSFGFGMILLKLSNFFGESGLNLVLGKIFSPAMLGVFERSNKIKTLPSMHLGNLLDKVLFPAMSQIQNEKQRLIRVFKTGLGIANTILIPLTVYLIFFSKQIVEVILGKEWMDAVLPLQIMFIVLPFSISSRMGDTIIRAKGHIYQNVLRKAVFVVFMLTSASFGAIMYGLAGAAVAVAVSFVFNYFLMVFLIRRVFGVRIKEVFFEPSFYGIVLGSVMALLIFLFKMGVESAYGQLGVISFVVFSALLAGGLFLVIVFKPSLLGDYSALFFKKLKQR